MSQILINAEQLKFINSPLDDAKLLGCPGGGKTSSIINKIQNHFVTKEFKTHKNFMVTTFSRKACEDFIAKANDLSKFNKDNVKTFHSLAGSIIQKLLNRSCTSIQVAIVSAINAVKSASKDDLLGLKCLTNIKVIFVDEAQDLSDIQWELVLLLKSKLKIKLILVGDTNQSIFQFQNSSDKYLLEYNCPNTYQLKENNRSTPEIVNLLNCFAPSNSNIPISSAVKSTNIKPIVFTGTHDEICTKIYMEIFKSKIPYHQIAIIGPVKKSDSTIKFGLQKITNMLSKYKIKHVKHYNESSSDDDYVNQEIETKLDHINVLTIHGAKGLEFTKVIIVNFHFKTFGKTPSQEEYNQFKYLWYVALSRAKLELTICCDSDKACWPVLRNCPTNLYLTEGSTKPILKEPKFSDTHVQNMDINLIVNNKQIFTEDILLGFYSDINPIETKQQMFKIDKLSDKVMLKYSNLVLQFLKAIFEYYYCLFHLDQIGVPFIDEIKNYVNNIVIVDTNNNVYQSFCSKSGLSKFNTITVDKLKILKNVFDSNERKLFEFVIISTNKTIALTTKTDDIFMDIPTIKQICDDVFESESEETLNWLIFKLCLFKYQVEHEAKHLWDNSDDIFKPMVKELSSHIKLVKSTALHLRNGYKFRQKCLHPNLQTTGIIDIVDSDGTIIMIKFSDSVDTTDKCKLFLHYHSHYYKWNTSMKAEIWNLKTGTKHIVDFSPVKSNIIISGGIAGICKTKLFNMIFVYDLETTGLNTDVCEIIERYIHELTHNAPISNGVIKARMSVPKIVQKLTGISQKEVNKGESLNVLRNEMRCIIDICDGPIFIAHNGNSFDHKVMRRQGLLFSDSCKTLDSKTIIAQLSEDKVKGTLSDIYKIVMGYKYKGKAHRAQADVQMLLEIFIKLGINETRLLQMC